MGTRSVGSQTSIEVGTWSVVSRTSILTTCSRQPTGSPNPHHRLARESKERTSPRAFVATPRSGVSQRYSRSEQNQKKKHREHRRHQRRRRPGRTAYSETMEDTSSTSSDECIKSKIRMRRERRVQKYTTTTYCEVILSTAVTSCFCLHLSTPLFTFL